MTPAQLAALKAAIAAETAPALVALRTVNNGGPDEQGIANWYNGASTTVCWRTNVTRSEIYHQTSAEGTNWEWNTYKSQAVTEQNAWTQMFMGDQADFSLPGMRTGVEKIFGAANAQTVHIKAIAKRVATRAEKVFATGTGTTAAPAVFGWQGQVAAQAVSDALRA